MKAHSTIGFVQRKPAMACVRVIDITTLVNTGESGGACPSGSCT